MKPSNASRPHLIITFGIPGSGKSFFAEHFAETFRAPIVSFDRLKLSDVGLTNDSIHATAVYMLGEIFKTGQTAVYDGPANTRTERLSLAKIARQSGYEPLLVWVQTDEITAKKRAMKSDDSHRIAIDENEFNSQVKHFSQPHKVEKVVVISGKHNYASQLKIVLRNLATIATSYSSENEPQALHTRRNIVLR